MASRTGYILTYIRRHRNIVVTQCAAARGSGLVAATPVPTPGNGAPWVLGMTLPFCTDVIMHVTLQYTRCRRVAFNRDVTMHVTLQYTWCRGVQGRHHECDITIHVVEGVLFNRDVTMNVTLQYTWCRAVLFNTDATMHVTLQYTWCDVIKHADKEDKLWPHDSEKVYFNIFLLSSRNKSNNYFINYSKTNLSSFLY